MGEVVAFSENQVETIVDTDGSQWFQRAHVAKYLNIPQI